MKQAVERIFQESIHVKQESLTANLEKIVLVSQEIIKIFEAKGKILFFGNGGSAADSQHIAAELIGRFQKERRALAAVALTTDTSILTSLGNDYTFDIIFSRQIEGLGQRGDMAFGISTSGNSKNVIEGIKQAKRMGLKTVSLTGRDGGQLAKLSDISLIVPSRSTARIQEAHLCIEHILCELVENHFIEKK
ncbi:MAG TPA: D-sedoheptulose 7-phosphate isomerase [Candidatus Omnitrophica bacterium]|nr:MAG: phosphoheptose isomerase [Omnitrophica WOR_2 bacterium GWA2_45_18]OGX19642.1 MAG: phosphoheptose isomerase [Omnitrophica WOR_2 bacterium GWC2_45_7]HBR14684.1 D-sedoheptulose 7-phosphate isomerase [Candidatus Omnitrophota bacterium]